MFAYTIVLSDDEGKEFDFGILSLVHKRDLLQIGDPVQFQVDSRGRAANLVAVRQKYKSTVNAIKGNLITTIQNHLN